MDISTIQTLIASLGFPIAMCCGLLWYIYKQSESHREETKEFTEALNNNTLVLQKLCDTLGIDRED